VVLDGVDIVRKTAPWYPDTFTAQDAQFLKSEGFTAARIGLAWTAVEPQPGVYDDSYIQKFVGFEHLLSQYGIRTLIDFHQDLWSAQNMPAWATLGVTYSDDFQAFWTTRRPPTASASRPTTSRPGSTSPGSSPATPTSSRSTRSTSRSPDTSLAAHRTRSAHNSRRPNWQPSTPDTSRRLNQASLLRALPDPDDADIKVIRRDRLGGLIP
jgi:hypothetical protein